MSAANAAALKQMFTPPPVEAGVVTTQEMQQQQWISLAVAKMCQQFAMIQLPLEQAALATVDSEIDSNPVTASEALRAEQETMAAMIQQYNLFLNDEYLNYTDGVNAWYENMTGGGAYVPLDQWAETQLSSYPNMVAIMKQVEF